MIPRLGRPISREMGAVAFLFLVGILLRLRQYLTGRSLWADEAMLALNIVNRSMADLLKPLEYDQGAPIGFLLAEKLVSLLFGRSEYALRLLLLLAGILSIGLFYLLVKRIAGRTGLLTAMALFVFNPRLVYYSSEVKQSIVDVVVCLALLLLASPLFEGKTEGRHFARLAAAGTLALWFSHPAVFVLAGIGLALLIVYVRRQAYLHVRYILGTGILWLVTLGLLYLLILQDIRQNTYMQEYWRGAFLPMPPWSEPAWFHRGLTENIGMQLGLPYAVYPVVILMLAGWAALWRGRPVYALAVGLILLVTLIASGLGLYPVFERMILFLVPIGILLLGKSVDFLLRTLRARPWLGRWMALGLAVFLIYGPLTTSIRAFIEPKYYEHIRPALEFLDATWKDGDTLFVSSGAVPAFEFYAPVYGLDSIPYRPGRRQDYAHPARIREQLNALTGERRVWLLFSHVYEKDGFNERDFILDHLKQNGGTRRREFRMPGTSVYLYLYDLGD